MKKALSIFFSAVVVIALLFPSTYFNAEENNEEKEDRNMGFCAIFMKPSVDISECRCYNLVK